MAVIENKRLIDLQEIATPSDDAYLLLDGSNSGAKKMSAQKLIFGDGVVKKIEVVSELPADAESHTDTLYLIKEPTT